MELRLDGKQADAGDYRPAVRQYRILRNFQRTGNASKQDGKPLITKYL